MREIFDWVASVYPAASGGEWSPVSHGGSDRRFWRGSGRAAGLVAVHYGEEKAENGRYAPCADFLHRHGVQVPAVLAHDAPGRRILMEDAGPEDLWSHREESWTVRRELYGKALAQLARMHTLDLREADARQVLCEPFDQDLYLWEQDYFCGNFLRAEKATAARAAVAMAAQARQLAAQPRVLVHRDFQSQNVMVKNGQVTLIDFQGMRAGLAGYDVASLLYDPYVDFSTEERQELSEVYAALAGRQDSGIWQSELEACARQRLMQALGAYGFLGVQKGKPAFLQYIPVASERLAALCEKNEEWHPLARSVREAARIFPS